MTNKLIGNPKIAHDEAAQTSLKAAHKKAIIIPIIIIILVGFTITIYSYIETKKFEENLAREVFEEESLHDISNAVINRFDNVLSLLVDIDALYSASTKVSRTEFRVFTKHELAVTPGIQAVEWIPYVRYYQREEYEAAARADGFPNFTFTERLSQGEMVSREEQDAYFPVYFIEPMLGNEAALGFDLASNPTRLKALNQAISTGKMVGTAPITLVQESGQNFGFIVFAPIFAHGMPINTIEERWANLKGFALGVFRIDDLMNAAIERLRDESISLSVYDISPTLEETLIFEQDPTIQSVESQAHFSATKVIEVAGRHYKLEFHSHDDFILEYQTSLPLFLLASGFFLTVLLASYLYSTQKQSLISRLQEARFRSYLENAADAMIIFTMKGEIVLVNHQASRLFQYSRDEVLEHTFGALFGEQGNKLFEQIGKQIDKNEDTHHNLMGIRKDGSTFPVAVKINGIDFEGERIISSSIRDMTEISEAQIALMESEEKYRDIFDNSSDMIQSVHMDGAFEFVNDVWLSVFGYTENEIQKLTLWDVIHPESLDHCKMIFSRVFKGESINDFNAVFLKKNGEEVLVEGNIAPRFKDGVINSTHVFCRDVTEKNKAEVEIKRVAGELVQLIDTANALIATFDEEGKITEWNRACSDVLGYTKEEMLGKTLPHLFPLKVRSDQSKMIATLQQGKIISNATLYFTTKQGGEIILSVNANPRYDEANNLIGALAVGQNITELHKYRTNLEELVEEQTVELKNALEDVQEADRLKSEFLSTAAHELRTPLTSIQGFSEILLTRQLNKDRRVRYLEMINNQSAGLGRIINDLLDLSRLEAGHGLEMSVEPFNLIGLIEEAVAGFAEIYPDHEIKIIASKNSFNILGDPNRLMQVGQNLISNALKYSPDGGKVTVQCDIIDDQLQLSVEDQGIGMKPDQLNHLFEKFYRGDASNTSIGGTGLGLAISKTIVELHGGKIWVESKFNEGTTIFVTLPIADQENSEDNV